MEENNKNKWQLKQRILYSLLLGFASSLTLFLFGPSNIYGNNSGEFGFVFADFVGFLVLYTLVFASVITLLMICLRGAVFEITFSCLFALTVLLFLQGNYLNFGLHSLGGDGNTEFKLSTVIVNAIIWIVVFSVIIALTVLFRKKHGEVLKTVSLIALITVIGMQLLSTTVLAFGGNLFKSHGDKVVDGEKQTVLTFDHITELSANKNIVYFLIDAFDYRYYSQLKKENPEIINSLDGFTIYEDAMAPFDHTYPGAPYLITGIKNTFNNEETRAEYFENAYKNSTYLKRLKENGYKINLYTEKYYVYEDARVMDEYINNSAPFDMTDYKINNPSSLAWKMCQLSLFRNLPYFAKNTIKVGTGSFSEHIIYNSTIPYTIDMKEVYNALNANDFTTFDDGNNFSFVHITGTHPPYNYDDDFNRVEDADPADMDATMRAARQSFRIINRYIDEMKRLGVYEDATIVITGDHGWWYNEPDYKRTTPIFFKESGNVGECKTDMAPVSHENIFASVLKSSGISYDGFALPLDEVVDDGSVVRTFYFIKKKDINGKSVDQIEVYEVRGRAQDADSWKYIRTIEYNKDMLE